MSQWGEPTRFADEYSMIRALPHVDTGGVFAPITATSRIDVIVLTDVNRGTWPDANALLERVKANYVGTLYAEWPR
jgi:hypothetical protein